MRVTLIYMKSSCGAAESTVSELEEFLKKLQRIRSLKLKGLYVVLREKDVLIPKKIIDKQRAQKVLRLAKFASQERELFFLNNHPPKFLDILHPSESRVTELRSILQDL